MLGLEAHPRPKLIDVPAFSLDRPVEKVAGIELHAGFGGADIDAPAAGRVLEPGRLRQGPRLCLVDHPVVVVTAAEPELLVRLLDSRPNRRWLTKVERRAGHGGQRPVWDQGRIDGRERSCMQRQHMYEKYAVALSVQVPVRLQSQDE